MAATTSCATTLTSRGASATGAFRTVRPRLPHRRPRVVRPRRHRRPKRQRRQRWWGRSRCQLTMRRRTRPWRALPRRSGRCRRPSSRRGSRCLTTRCRTPAKPSSDSLKRPMPRCSRSSWALVRTLGSCSWTWRASRPRATTSCPCQGLLTAIAQPCARSCRTLAQRPGRSTPAPSATLGSRRSGGRTRTAPRATPGARAIGSRLAAAGRPVAAEAEARRKRC
mmetsp:Transcript_3065/g.8289  ORF Transcript_3065/g.8289 Transcript_3065/m.8289 type:complete len:223 (+) Transcript_3065:542-1210(+)